MDRLNISMHPFFSESAISALYQHEIFTSKDFISCDSQKLSKISLLVFREILEIKRHLMKKYAADSENAYNSYQHLLKNSAIIPSGVQSIDQFMEGGLLTSNIYEICGKASSGKTLFAYVFMKNLVLQMKQNCFLLDATNDFDTQKFSLLCTGYSEDDISCGLSRIFIKSIYTKYDLVNSLQEIAEKLDKKFLLRMIVIDSLSAVILNNNDPSHNNLILSHLGNLMHYISCKYHVVFFTINLVTTWIEGDFSSQLGSKNTISCGRFWYTMPNTRLKLESEKPNFKLSVEKSNILKLGSATIPFEDITG